jgi:hypothetical protein
MRTALRIAALAALALPAPAAAWAQGCIGAPVPERARAVQVQAGISTVDVGREFDSTDLGLGYRANPGGPLAYSVEYLLRSVGDSDSRVHTGNAALALRVPLPLPLLTVCARTGAGVARLSQEGSGSSYTNVTVPAALVLELPLPVGIGRTLAPYVAPQFLWSQTTGEVFGFDDLDASDTGFGVEAGVGLRVNRFLLGAGGSWSDLDPLLATPAFPDRALFARVGMLF